MPKRNTPGLRAMADLATPMAIRVAATLRVADHVAAGRRSAAAMAAEIGAHPDALDRLMRHLVSIGLFRRDEHGDYATTELGDQLREDHPGGRRKWLDMEGATGRGDLSFVELAHSVLTGEPAYPVRYGTSFWADLAADPTLSSSFDTVMQHHVELDNSDIAGAYGWAALKHVVDVGGGSGGLLSVLLARHDALRGTLVDVAGPAAGARQRFRELGLAGRTEVVTGSFFDPLPGGADAYVLSAILHDWDDEHATRILRRCAQAAGPQGVVLVIEAIGADGESPNTAMDLRMLAYYGGKERGLAQLRELAGRAGLAVRGVHQVRQGSFISIAELVAA
ncbi:methyltransferase [Dactylosporangium sp. NPDC051484]|uniref:methyltransferase n=1 Tax=Dactylosporangium sp. NPDC051484 TaxID=3154942 RepID=UPI00344B0B0D